MILYILIAVMAICWGAGGAMQKHGIASEFPKLSMKTLAEDWRRILKALFMSKVWMGGLVVTTVGGGSLVYATSIGDISLIQPLTNMSGAVAVLIGVSLLGERLHKGELLAVVMLIGGAVMVGFSSETRTAHPPHQTVLFLLTGAATAALMGGFALFTLKGQRLGGGHGLIMAFAAGIAFGLTNLYVKVVTEVAKGTGDGLRLDIEGIQDVFLSYPVYVLLAALLIGMVGFQLACAHGRIAIIQPVTTVFSNILPIVGGWLVFEEAMNPGKLIGIGVILTGTVLLTAGRSGGESDPP